MQLRLSPKSHKVDERRNQINEQTLDWIIDYAFYASMSRHIWDVKGPLENHLNDFYRLSTKVGFSKSGDEELQDELINYKNAYDNTIFRIENLITEELSLTYQQK